MPHPNIPGGKGLPPDKAGILTDELIVLGIDLHSFPLEFGHRIVDW